MVAMNMKFERNGEPKKKKKKKKILLMRDPREKLIELVKGEEEKVLPVENLKEEVELKKKRKKKILSVKNQEEVAERKKKRKKKVLSVDNPEEVVEQKKKRKKKVLSVENSEEVVERKKRKEKVLSIENSEEVVELKKREKKVLSVENPEEVEELKKREKKILSVEDPEEVVELKKREKKILSVDNPEEVVERKKKRKKEVLSVENPEEVVERKKKRKKKVLSVENSEEVVEQKKKEKVLSVENSEEVVEQKKKEKVLSVENSEEVVPSTSSNTDGGDKEVPDLFELQALSYRISAKFAAKRNLFLKKDASNDCSMIVANVPPFISTDSLGRLLSKLGSGNPVEIIPQRSTVAPDEQITDGYYTAAAHFKTEQCVVQSLRRCEKIPCICLSDIGIEIARCGATKYCGKYRSAYKTVDELQHNVDSYIEKHDAEVQEEKRKAKRMANVPDEEGWITVTRTHYKRLPAAVVVKNKEDLLKFSKKKKRMEDNIAFYSFQLKQSKIKHMEEMRRKFEEDKKKLAIARAARKFRPL